MKNTPTGMNILCIAVIVAVFSMTGMAAAVDLTANPRLSGMGKSQMSPTGQEQDATSIYSQGKKDTDSKVGIPPAAPKTMGVNPAEPKEEKAVQKAPVPAPPATTGPPKTPSRGQAASRPEAADALSLDAFHPTKPDSFERVAQAVEQSLKAHITIPPELLTTVRMSNRDINRITCQEGLIKDVVYSKEKGLMINFTGKDAFLKYRIIKTGNKMAYVTGPTELYIACNEQIYTLIAVPEGIPAQIIRLSSGVREKIKKNQSVYGGMAIERKIMALIKAVYTDTIPDSFTIQKVGKNYNMFRDVNVTLDRIVGMDGEGIQVKELKLRLSEKSALDKVKISEKDFLDVEITKNTMGIAVDNATLAKGKTVRVFICEKTGSEAEVKHDRQ